MIWPLNIPMLKPWHEILGNFEKAHPRVILKYLGHVQLSHLGLVLPAELRLANSIKI